MEEIMKRLNLDIDNLRKQLSEIKKEINFDLLIIEYKKTKKKIKKLNLELNKELNDKEKVKKINIELNILKEEHNKHLEKFKKTSNIEKKIYAIRHKIIKKISTLDKSKNSFDYQIKAIESRNEIISNSIDPKYNENLKKEIEKLQKDLIILKDKLEELKRIKKPQNLILYEINKLTSLIKKKEYELKINLNSNDELVKQKINSTLNRIDSRKNNSNNLKNQIDELVKILNKIDSSLEHKDSDEYGENFSFIVKNLNAWYGSKQALYNINIELPKNEVIAIIGPSGCGKSTFLRTLNRINDNNPLFKTQGKIILDGEYDIYKLRSIKNRYDKMELSTLRTKVGMIFQQPNPFPMSIYKNVTYGPKVKGIKNKSELNEILEKSLKDAGLYEEVKDNLKVLGTSLSGGQQQRLCIARAIANRPDVLLMDEPTSALDPIAAKKIEDLIIELKKNFTIIMVTHSMQQAQRISDKIAFFFQGELIEYGNTKQIFENPKQKQTKEYISGKFG